jgi:hypothetical protein
MLALPPPSMVVASQIDYNQSGGNYTWLLVPPKENSWKGVGYDG